MRIAVINIVGLSESLPGPHMPQLTAFAHKHDRQSYAPEFPAVTCSAQSSIVTGRRGLSGVPAVSQISSPYWRGSWSKRLIFTPIPPQRWDFLFG